MTTINSLRIRIGLTDVASLFRTDDGRVYLHFDDAYIEDPKRPILSCSYQSPDPEVTKAQLRNLHIRFSNGPGNGRLPPFFQNLLPEGQLRKHLVERANIAPNNEFDLLAYCGKSLPGNVYATSETLNEKQMGRLIGQGRDSYEMSSEQLPPPEAESLSGIQPKVGLVNEGGRYVMRSKNEEGQHFIGKLPTSDSALLPEVEYSSLKLAEAAGATVCKAELLPLTAISGNLPFTLQQDARTFLLVHRFDRDAPTVTKRLHMEDFCQIIGIESERKYSANYAAIGAAILANSSKGEQDIFELLRRIKINELLGNRDAHAKNFSLLYTDPWTCELSPAYDVVAHSAYSRGAGHGLFFTSTQTKRKLLAPEILRELSNIWGIPEVKMTAVVADTVDKAMTKWPDMIQALPFSDNQRAGVLSCLMENKSAKAWLVRNTPKRPKP